MLRFTRISTFEKTAQVVEANNPDFVFGEGDMSNVSGTATDYQQCAKAGGKFISKTYAVSGNHDNDSSAFYDYFNGAGTTEGVPVAGRHTEPRGKGYFSVNVGSGLQTGLDPYSTGGKFTAGDAQMVWLDSIANHCGGRPITRRAGSLGFQGGWAAPVAAKLDPPKLRGFEFTMAPSVEFSFYVDDIAFLPKSMIVVLCTRVPPLFIVQIPR